MGGNVTQCGRNHPSVITYAAATPATIHVTLTCPRATRSFNTTFASANNTIAHANHGTNGAATQLAALLKNITCNGNRGATVHANAANPPITPVHHKVSRNVPVPSPSAAAR